MSGSRLVIEYALRRSEKCNLLEMSISELDAGKDLCGLTEPVEEKVKSLENIMDVVDSQLHALKEEEPSLAQDLEDAQSFWF